MIKVLTSVLLAVFLLNVETAFAKRYGEKLCTTYSWVDCVKVKRGQTWHSMFPGAEERDIVMRINRMNIRLRPGMLIAVPRSLPYLDRMDVAPFPSRIEPHGKKVLVFDQKKLAWGAYNQKGYLLNWGPAAGGRGYCPDVGRQCRTTPGVYRIYRKGTASCVSSKYPIGRGGAPMQYCMFFNGGYAFHASPEVPGRHASHGCVRLFKADARWLNQEFVDTRGGTKVIVTNL